MITVKHRRADEETWLLYDPVIPDGELALVSGDCGYDIKVGDGVRSFSALPPLMGKHEMNNEDYPSVTLRHRDHVSCVGIYSAFVSLDTEDQPDYTAMLTLRTMEEIPEISFTPSDIVFSGCDVSDGVFWPQGCKKYTLLFWRDDEINCHVRGVYV